MRRGESSMSFWGCREACLSAFTRWHVERWHAEVLANVCLECGGDQDTSDSHTSEWRWM